VIEQENICAHVKEITDEWNGERKLMREREGKSGREWEGEGM